jgi:hypothetical protein
MGLPIGDGLPKGGSLVSRIELHVSGDLGEGGRVGLPIGEGLGESGRGGSMARFGLLCITNEPVLLLLLSLSFHSLVLGHFLCLAFSTLLCLNFLSLGDGMGESGRGGSMARSIRLPIDKGLGESWREGSTARSIGLPIVEGMDQSGRRGYIARRRLSGCLGVSIGELPALAVLFSIMASCNGERSSNGPILLLLLSFSFQLLVLGRFLHSLPVRTLSLDVLNLGEGMGESGRRVCMARRRLSGCLGVSIGEFSALADVFSMATTCSGEHSAQGVPMRSLLMVRSLKKRR